MDQFVALLLTIQAGGALISPPIKTFNDQGACLAYVATVALPARQSLGCVAVTDLEMLLRHVWKRRPADIWK